MVNYKKAFSLKRPSDAVLLFLAFLLIYSSDNLHTEKLPPFGAGSMVDERLTFKGAFASALSFKAADNLIKPDNKVTGLAINAAPGTNNSGYLAFRTDATSCIAMVSYGALTASATNFSPQTIETCNYAGEYATVTLPGGGEWIFESSRSTDFLHITDAANNTLVSGVGSVPYMATGPITVRVHIFIDDNCQTQSACRVTSVTFKVLAATVAIDDTSLTVGETATVTITFPEAVMGFDNDDLTIPNGTLSDVISTNGNVTFTATFTPTDNIEEATNVISVDNTGVTDLNGNAGEGTTDSDNFTIDTKRPTVSSIVRQTPTDATTNTNNVTFRVTFSEEVNNVDIADFELSGAGAEGTASITGVNQESMVFDVAVGTINTNGELDLDFTEGHNITDISGNSFAGTITTEEVYTIDQTAPIVEITSESGDPVGGAFTVTVTFSEAVTGFATEELSVMNGLASGLMGSGTTYTATITPASDGMVTVDIASGVAADAAGNGNAAADQFSITNDETAPTVVLDTESSDPVSGSFDLGIVFSESVEGFELSELSVVNGSASGLMGSGTTYTATITPSSEGLLTVDIASGVAADAAGNGNAAADQFSITNDETAPGAPVVSSISDDTGKSGDDQITKDNTISFNGTAEANSTIVVFIDTNNRGNTTADGSGNWTFDASEGEGGLIFSDGDHSIAVTATDAAGNTSIESVALPFTVDTEAPTNVFLPPIEEDDIINAGEVNDIVVTGATTGVADGQVVSITITDGVNTPVQATATVMSDEWSTGNIDVSSLDDGNIQITANVADIAGNDAEKIMADLVLDTSAPAAPVITGISTDSGTSSDDEITNDNTLNFIGTAEANSTVEVFIDGSSIGTTTADGSGDWTYDHTGTTLADDTYAVTATATDAAGNTSEEGTALDVTVDTVAPAAPTVDFDAVADLGISDTDNLTSGATFSFSGTAEPNSFVVLGINNAPSDIDPIQVDGDGNWTSSGQEESIPSGVYPFIAIATDVAGNESEVSDVLTVTYDQDLAISSISPADDETDVLPNANLTITFDKNVFKGTGNINIKQVSDDTVIETIDVAGSNVTISGATVTIDPVDFILPPDTEFYVNIDAGAFENEAGAPFAGISDNSTWSFTIIDASVVTSVQVPADDTYMIGDNLDFTVNMVLPISISGTATIPLTIGSSTVNATQVGTVSNSNTILFRYTILEDQLDADGVALGTAMDLNGGTMRDEFGVDAILALNGVASTAAVQVDGVKPTPTITSTAVDLVNGTFSATITYDEAVDNVEVGDITVVNGMAGNLQSVSAGTAWTVDITPTADGTVSLSLAANTANDLAGNDSKASNSVSREFDGTPPEVISVNRTDSDPVNTGVTEVNYQIVFSEDVTGVDMSDLDVVLTGSATATLNTLTPLSATTYNLNLNGVGGEGTIGLNVKADDTIIDAATNPLAAAFTGQVYTTNFVPTDISLTATSIDENNALTATVAGLSSADDDAGDSHTYTLVSGTGDTDNASFAIDGTNLTTNNVSFDFETDASYDIRLRTDDGKGGTFEKAFTITVNNVNEVPSMLSLSNNTIDESDNAQDVGTLASLDQDGGETFTYSLTSGTGDTDNREFEINGTTLRTAGAINFEDGPTRSILVRVTDSGGLTLDQQFTINIDNVVEEPVRPFTQNTSGADVKNIFSPNGDGTNETWVIEDILDNPVNEVRVYAQGGKLLLSQTNYQNDWDGTFKGDPIPDGTYYYEITIFATSQSTEPARVVKGFLTIIRN